MKSLLCSLSLLVLGLSPLYAFQTEIEELSLEPVSKAREGIILPIHLLRLTLKKGEAEFEELSYGPHKRQILLVAKPKNIDSTKAPKLFFFIHGGGWHIGKPKQHRYLASRLVEEGYTVVLPGYRRAPKYCYEDMQKDINQALLKSMEILGISADAEQQILIGGVSAGANLAALMAFDEDRLKRLGLNSSIFKGFVSLAGPLDLDKMEETNALARYAGEPESATFAMANPINYVNEVDCFPAFFMHGKRDGLVPYQSTESFVCKLQEENEQTVFELMPNRTHIDITNRWYYKEKADYGQEELLIEWIKNLD
jgi:acetyl esterase/lipase